jgi:hypothetical protein
MSELLEYFLAFAVGSLFAVASVAVYGNYSSFESNIQVHSLLGDLLALASRSLENGSAHATLAFPESVVSCDASEFTLRSANLSAQGMVQGACSFALRVPAGIHQVVFSASGSQISMQVA